MECSHMEGQVNQFSWLPGATCFTPRSEVRWLSAPAKTSVAPFQQHGEETQNEIYLDLAGERAVPKDSRG